MATAAKTSNPCFLLVHAENLDEESVKTLFQKYADVNGRSFCFFLLIVFSLFILCSLAFFPHGFRRLVSKCTLAFSTGP